MNLHPGDLRLPRVRKDFRCGDVAAGVAFLAMDLRYRDRRDLADDFVGAYIAASGDEGLPFVLHMSSPDKFWNGLFDVVGHPEWAVDARFNNRAGRIKNYDALAGQLEPIFRAGRRDEWLRRLLEKDVPAAPINTLDEVFADPQVIQQKLVETVTHPTLGALPRLANPVNMQSLASGSVRTPPRSGLDPRGAPSCNRSTICTSSRRTTGRIIFR